VTNLRLTELSHRAGCGCKLAAQDLHPLLGELWVPEDASLLVGADSADDAAVYRLSDDLAIVTSVDFFTPTVDEPRDYGRIAAANALSDIYAMGATPLCALNLVAYSLESFPAEVLKEILRGGSETARSAGVAVVGGHSIDDAEPKYGLAVTGTVRPDSVVRNSTGRPGDDLYLTKPLGGGVVATALKRGLAPKSLVAEATEVMATLNKQACRMALAADISAMTDVTGFGLLGHLLEMTTASGIGASLQATQVPAIDGVLDLLDSDTPPIAAGTYRNWQWVRDSVWFAADVPKHLRWLLCDAMTSGGLLIAARPGSRVPGHKIGRLLASDSITVSA
jgi:selenide, water dikinase